MTKTAREVITRAYRRAGIADSEESLEAHQYATGLEIMQGIMDELVTVHGATIAWDVDTVPDGLFLPMAHAVAVEVNVDYPVRPPFDTRSRALMRLRAALFPDDRAARADLDDDGTVTADEAAADARGAFY